MRPPLASALVAIRPNGSTLNVEEVLASRQFAIAILDASK